MFSTCSTEFVGGKPPMFHWCLTLQETKNIYIYNNISHIGKRKIIFKQTLEAMYFFAVQAEVPSSEFNSSQDSEWHSDTSSAMSSYLRQFQVVETMDKSQPDVWEHHEISRNNSCVNKCRVQIFDATYATLPETKVALESQWLDDSFPFGKAYSQVLSSFQGV